MTSRSEPAGSAASAAVAQVIEPRIFERVKGFKLRRVLANAPAVGPFVLFDHFGPVTFGIGQGLDAGPHPHVGMATLTYLFEGSLLHRDSMGNAAPLAPGAANWMVCGRGVAHSERTPREARERESRLHGAQLWLALPRGHEEDAPHFQHHPAAALPVLEDEGRRLRTSPAASTVRARPSPRSPARCASMPSSRPARGSPSRARSMRSARSMSSPARPL